MAAFSFPDLKGKTFVVSGSSSGMGKQIALLLGQQGANVGLLDLVASKDVAEEIEKMQSGAKTIILKADVTKGAEVDAAYDQVAAAFGRLDGGANMAGIAGIDDAGDPNNTVEKLPDSHWEKVMAINVDGVRNCMRAQLRLMKGTGSIVNAASISGQVASPWSVPYSVSKFGVIGMTKGAAGEVGTRGIRVNAVAPGFVKTPFTEKFNQENMMKMFGWRIPLGRMANPEEIGRVVVFLLSDVSSYVNGSVVNVDGGYS